MNKYDKELLELAPKDGTIYELLRRPVRSSFFHFVSILFDNIPWIIDGLSSKGAYYLHINEGNEKAVLIHIDRNINSSQEDVTTAVGKSANKKSFVFENNRYKLHRKVR